MLTVSLVKEAQFISFFLRKKVSMTLTIDDAREVSFSIDKDVLTVEYLNKTIWRESISGASSNFGVESCDTITRIMASIERGEDWEKKYKHSYI